MQIGNAWRWHSGLRRGEPLRRIRELSTPAGLVEAVAYAPGRSEGRHYHSRPGLIYIIAGDHWAAHRLGGETCRAGTVRFLPAGEPHETYFPLGSTCLQIEPLPPIVELAAVDGRALDAPGEVRDPRAARLGARLFRELVSGDDLSMLGIEDATLQLLRCDGCGDRSHERAPPPWVLHVADMLRAELQTRFALSAIASSVGRHPVQVSRAFRRHFGCTLSDYVRRARVARAQQLLRQGALSLSEIALECGFCDQSHFTTAFRRLTGVPPQRYRARSQEE